MNYAALTTLIEATTQNNDPVFLANIDRFIQTAERRIHMEANLPSSRKNLTGTLTVGSRQIATPLDYIVGKSVEVVTATGVFNLIPKAAEFLTEMYPDSTIQAQPKYYAQYTESLLTVAPTPDLAYTVNFHYFAMPNSIVIAGTTWLGDKFEQTLLYAALLEAYVFMKGSPDIMAYYKAGYDAGMAEIKAVTSAIKMNDFRS